MATNYPVYPFMGVLTQDEVPNTARLILAATASPGKDQIQILNDTGKTEEHDSTDITVDPETARMSFVSDGNKYRIREPRESDGSWLSKYKTSLPVEAIRAFTLRGDSMNPDETLDAFATDDSPYLVGLVYTNGVGRWSRIDEDWVLLAPTDDTFAEMNVFEIDPERAQEFIDLYDSSYVSITDAEQYESAESEGSVEDNSTDSADNISD